MKLYAMIGLLAATAVSGFFSVAHMLEYYERAGLNYNPFDWYEKESTGEVLLHGQLFAIMGSGIASASFLTNRYWKH